MRRLPEWTPDIPSLENPGLTVCDNVLPSVGCYRSFPAAVTFADTGINYRPRGVFAFFTDDPILNIYAGSETTLWNVSYKTPINLTNSGTSYSLSVDHWWDFIKFGDSVYATQINDPIQVSTLGANFADLGGGSPKAKFIAATKNFVVVGYTEDAVDGIKPQRVWWSAISDPGTWPTPGSASAAELQSGNEDLSDSEGGEITALIGGESVTIFLKRAIYAMQYVGGETVWQFNKLDSNVGLYVRKCAVRVGQVVFFLADSGFYALSGGVTKPIGYGKVDKYFWDNVSQDGLTSCHVAADIRNRCVIWMYPRASTGALTADAGLCFNWETGQWSRIVVNDPLMFSSAVPGYTLEDLDYFSSSIDAITTSLDSAIWQGGDPLLAGFTSDYKVQTYSGTAMDATIETQEMELSSEVEDKGGYRSILYGVRPIFSGAPTVTVDVGIRDLQSASPSYLASVATVNTRTGMHDVRVESRYHRVKILTTGAFTQIAGYDLDFRVGAKF